jgi:hypothetical protein
MSREQAAVKTDLIMLIPLDCSQSLVLTARQDSTTISGDTHIDPEPTCIWNRSRLLPIVRLVAIKSDSLPNLNLNFNYRVWKLFQVECRGDVLAIPNTKRFSPPHLARANDLLASCVAADDEPVWTDTELTQEINTDLELTPNADEDDDRNLSQASTWSLLVHCSSQDDSKE